MGGAGTHCLSRASKLESMPRTSCDIGFLFPQIFAAGFRRVWSLEFLWVASWKDRVGMGTIPGKIRLASHPSICLELARIRLEGN